MKRLLLFLIPIALVGASVVIFSGKRTTEEPLKQANYETKQDSRGEITVEVAPVKLSRGDKVVFRVLLDTHSVELNYDLKNLAVLSDDKGREYKALNWTGGLGGHHIEGELSFPPVNKDTKTINLKIFSIDKIDKVFSWNFE